MTKESDHSLRKKAEELLLNRKKPDDGVSEDLEKLLLDMQSQQIELESENAELRNAQYVLESSREKYLDLYERAPVGYLLVDEQGVIVKANLTFCALFGEQRFNVIGKSFTQWICGEFQDSYYLFRRRCLESEKNISVDLRLRGLDGNKFFVRVQGIREKVSGRRSGLRLAIGVVSDENELQFLQQEMRRMALHLECALDAADGGFWQLNFTDSLMWLDTRVARIMGLGEEPVEMDFSLFLDTIHGDDRGRVQEAIISHMVANNNIFEEEFRFHCPDTGLSWLNARGRVTERNAKGQAIKMKGILLGINRRKKLERDLENSRFQLFKIVDHLPACISYIGSDQRYRLNNEFYEDLFGISAQACRGKYMWEVIGEQGYRNCRHQVEAVLNGQEVHFENVVFSPQRGKRLLQVSYIPDLDHEKMVKGFFVLAYDITNSRQIQKLEEANIALKVVIDQQQSTREEMEQNLLDKLKKLVFPYLDLLQGQPDAARQHEYLSIIRAHLDSVTDSFTKKLSNPLLNLSPREILVADLVRQGRSTQDMAELLGLSERTVEAYRMQLRKKLGLRTKKENLYKYLLHTFGKE